MKVTNHGLKGRQLQKEDYWQKAAAEQQGYAGVPIHVRIAENNNIIADLHKQECENKRPAVYRTVRTVV